jgi:hypothetical protein
VPEASARAAGSERARVPDFFIVGAPKCGTTALYRMLRAHPQVYMPELKEPHFLAREPGEQPQSKRRPVTLEGYLALFAPASPEQLVGEASTSYLRSPLAADAIAELNPQARIVAILREPAALLRSLHLQLLQSSIETEPDLAKAIELEPGRRAAGAQGLWQQTLLYSEHVRYVEQLRRYHERFGRERVLVLIYDDFRADNEGVTREVMRFLGVDDGVELQQAELNPTVRLRRSRTSALMHDMARGRGPLPRVARRVTRVVPRRMRRGALGAIDRRLVVREPPPPDEATMRELQLRFADEVQATGDYLHRDLPSLWGYRRLDSSASRAGQ